MPVLILHYHEIWLKGCNRNFFIAKLKDSIELVLDDLPILSLRHEENRILVRFKPQGDEAARVIESAVQRLTKVPGIAYLAVAHEVSPDLDEIVERGSELMLATPFYSFAVRAKRSHKGMPFRSGDVQRILGRRIEERAAAAGRSVKVDLDHPDATCRVEVMEQQALVYTEKILGVGGLPTGTAGRLTCLLSGGFDSAVAAYKIIRRGVRLSFVHFYGPAAHPGEDSPPIARELVRILTAYQGRSNLYLVPFNEIQQQIVAGAPEAVRILLYRRFMLRIAERISWKEKAHGTITGDSIAQVASQTLQNMEAVGAVATRPLYRPLVGDDKQDILAIAQKIGTYAVSCEPFTDCCPIYLPKSPRIFATIRELDAAESALDIPAMVKRGVELSRKECYEYRSGQVVERERKVRQSEHESVPAGVR